MPTPTLPDWIRNVDIAGYESAHRLCPDSTRLYGTESLYGDWGGRVLLLAKDFGPSSMVQERLDNGDPGYEHDGEILTNKRLRHFAEPFQHFGLLYGSALANLLRNDGKMSGSLPNGAAALLYGQKVVTFVIERMPRLEWIVCMGKEAWHCARAAERERGDWRVHRESGKPLGRLIGTFHPAARTSYEQMARPWSLFAARLRIDPATTD